MTMTADGTADTLNPGDARDVLREMAAVVRTVFGAGLQASRTAPTPVAAESEPVQPQVVAMPPQEPAPAPIATAPAASAAAPVSIPMPTSLPLPDVPAEAVTADADDTTDITTDITAEDDQPAEVDEAPAPYAGEVPALRLVPNPPGVTPAAPVENVTVEHRQSVLREVAFLDDF